MISQIVHTVIEGDSLFSIARRYYGIGKGYKWRKLYKDNREEIGDNPDIIKSGMEIIVKKPKKTD